MASTQAAPDSVPLRVNTEVRAKVAALGPNWQSGRVVQILLTATRECFGFAPDDKSVIGALTLNATDSLEVKVPGPEGRMDAAQRDSLHVPVRWVGVPRDRLQILSRGCERVRP